jgi:hypothetical protein
VRRCRGGNEGLTGLRRERFRRSPHRTLVETLLLRFAPSTWDQRNRTVV